MKNEEQLEFPRGEESVEKEPEKVLMIDDYPGVIMGASDYFSDFPNFTAVQCQSVEEALRAIDEHRPEIIFLDHSLTRGGDEGLEIAEAVKSKYPKMKIVSTTSRFDVLDAYHEKGVIVSHVDKGNFDALREIISQASKN